MPRERPAESAPFAHVSCRDLPCRLGGVHRNEGPPIRGGPFEETGDAGAAQDFVAGLTPGLSLKNCLFSSMKFFH